MYIIFKEPVLNSKYFSKIKLNGVKKNKTKYKLKEDELNTGIKIDEINSGLFLGKEKGYLCSGTERGNAST